MTDTTEAASQSNSIFEEPWWLDAVAPGLWGEAIVRAGEAVVARLPYVLKRRGGLVVVGQPPLTQTLGPWMDRLPQKQSKRAAREKTLVADLLGQIPRFHLMQQDLAPSFTNALPFYWAGFDVRVRYTYRIDDVSDLNKVWSEFDQRARRSVRKAEQNLEVRPSEDIEPLIKLIDRTLRRAGARAPDPDLVRRIDSVLAGRGRRSLFYAVDSANRMHAVAYFVWDDFTTYYLLGGRDEAMPEVGAPSLLMWAGIQGAAQRGQIFDFEGSMLAPIEEFFRGFGGVPTPYLRVSKIRGAGHLLAAARGVRERRRGR